jgi:hypothetical protein
MAWVLTIRYLESVKLKVKQATYKAFMAWPNIQFEERSNVRSTLMPVSADTLWL